MDPIKKQARIVLVSLPLDAVESERGNVPVFRSFDTGLEPQGFYFANIHLTLNAHFFDNLFVPSDFRFYFLNMSDLSWTL